MFSSTQLTSNANYEKNNEDSLEGRNPDGTFTKGSEAAKEAGHRGGLIAQAHQHHHHNISSEGRNPDGTFTKGSEAAKEAGHIGGIVAHDHAHTQAYGKE